MSLQDLCTSLPVIELKLKAMWKEFSPSFACCLDHSLTYEGILDLGHEEHPLALAYKFLLA